MKINIFWAECVGNLDPYSNWFGDIYAATNCLECDYIFLSEGETLSDNALSVLGETFPDNDIQLTWWGDESSYIADCPAKISKTWFIKFTVD